MGTSCEWILDISRHFVGYTGVYSLDKRLHGTHNLQKYPYTCNQPAAHMEALTSALNLTKWVPTRCNQEQQLNYISEKSPSAPSCSLACGWEMLFFATTKNRWSNSRATLRRRYWPFGLSVISRTLLLNEYFQKTPCSATIVVKPRQGEILDATNHDERNYWRSPCTPDWRTGWCSTIYWRIIYFGLPKA